jgi:hypothetical protein
MRLSLETNTLLSNSIPLLVVGCCFQWALLAERDGYVSCKPDSDGSSDAADMYHANLEMSVSSSTENSFPQEIALYDAHATHTC